MQKMNLSVLFDNPDILNNSPPTPQASTTIKETKADSHTVSEILLEKLVPFDKHPFKPYTEEKLQELATSIEENGIILPLIVRPLNDRYQIISGHNRAEAARLIKLDCVPCLIHDVDNSTAELEMVESNLKHREKLLPSEKAFAYKIRYEALLSKRNELRGQIDHGARTATILADNSPDSEKQIRRYISLTKLVPAFLDKVDDDTVPFMAGVYMSYLKQDEQQIVLDFLEEKKLRLDIKSAEKIKDMQRNVAVTYDELNELFFPENVKPKRITAVKVRYKKIKQYFSNDAKESDIEDTIIKALELYFKRE